MGPITINLRSSLVCAVRDVQIFIREKRKADNERSDLEKNARRNGITAENIRFRDQMESIERSERTACSSASNSFAKHIEECRTAIKKAAYPAGEQIIGDKTKADIWLLEHDYITRPEELKAMRERYASPINPAMLRIIACYAASHNAFSSDTFAFETDATEHMAACERLVLLAEAAFADVYCGSAETIMGFVDPETDAAICAPLYDSENKLAL